MGIYDRAYVMVISLRFYNDYLGNWKRVYRAQQWGRVQVYGCNIIPFQQAGILTPIGHSKEFFLENPR